jgi:hypothetical protein
MDLNGANQVVLVSDFALTPFDVRIGPDNRLYWVGGGDGLRMGSSNLDGSDHIAKLVSVGATAFGMAVVPVAPVAPLTISSINVAGSVATITWTGGTGPFQLQRRSSLSSGNWENVGTSTTDREATDTVGTGSMFYRVAGN